MARTGSIKKQSDYYSFIRLTEVGVSPTDFSVVYKDQQLIERPCFNLPFRETNLVISSYSAKHRLAIIDRWQELEIAKLTGKQHDNVLRDIRKVLNEIEIDGLKFEAVYLAGNGQERPCFNLPRLECDLFVSGYSAKYRLAIIDLW